MRKPAIIQFKVSIYILVFLLGCSVESSREEIPDYKLASAFGIDSAELVYQYYQKFGFTDVCEDIRFLYRKTDTIQQGKNLPINAQDLLFINDFQNKHDGVVDSSITINSELRTSFNDIELMFISSPADTNFTIGLSRGKYEIVEMGNASMLKIFDANSGLMYLEVHRCD